VNCGVDFKKMNLAMESASEAYVDLSGKAKLRILHVDDDAEFIAVAKQCLEEQYQFQVDTTSSAEEALKKLENSEYDAIISDYQMPGKNGLELLRALRQQGRDIPFILLTCKSKEEVAIEALNSGVEQYITKHGDAEATYEEVNRSILSAVNRRKTGKLLKESEEKYRKLFEEGMDAIFVADAETGILIDCNRAATELTGRTKSELIGMHQRFLHPEEENGPEFGRVFEQHRSDKEGQTIEDHIITKSGEVRDVTIKPSLIEVNGKRIVQGIFRDITEQKNRIDKIGFQARLLNAVGQAVTAADINGNIIYWNHAAEQLYGWSEAEALGSNVREILLKDFFQEDAAAVLSHFNTMKSWTGETTLKRRDGELVQVIIVTAPIVNEKGELAGILGVSTDVTEKKWMQEVFNDAIGKVVELNEKLRVVESLTRHDIRNKLSAVNGRIFLLKKRLTDNIEASAQLKEMDLASQQILRILEFERFYVQVGSEELQWIDVEKHLSEAASLFSDLKGAQVINDCHGLTVLADSLLRQLFYNLIDNTLKYGVTVSKIKVHFQEEKDQLKLIYEDNGVGMPDEVRNKLFTEGFGKGTGFGLFLIKRIVEAYGWTIQETGKQGQGAQFTMTIPKIDKEGKKNYEIK
jgi:PAS domain S-box-containing protein